MEGIRQVTPELAALGVETTLACLHDPAALWLHEFPCRVEALGPGAGGYGYRRGLVPRLCELAAEHDVVIVHGLWQYHGLLAWRALSGGPALSGADPRDVRSVVQTSLPPQTPQEMMLLALG